MRASVVVAHGLLSSCGLGALEHRLSSCDAQVLLPCSMWNLPGPGLEPVFPALAGRFLTTGPPGKSKHLVFNNHCSVYIVFLPTHHHVSLKVTMEAGEKYEVCFR